MSDLYRQAAADAQRLRETALENAKNILVESLAPRIQEVINGEIDYKLTEQDMNLSDGLELESLFAEADEEEEEDVAEARGGKKGDRSHELDYENEAKDDRKGPEGTWRKGERSEELDELGGEYMAGEGLALEAEEEEEDLDELFIDENELMAALASLTEVEVSKGFGDEGKVEDTQTKEVDAGDEADTLVHHVDYSVKENRKLKQALKALALENRKLRKTVKKLYGSVNEVNLFNAKLAYANRLLQNAQSPKTRERIVESLDKASSVREVKLIAESWLNAMKTRPSSTRTTRRTGSSAAVGKPTQLKESFHSKDRWQELAGLLKG